MRARGLASALDGPPLLLAIGLFGAAWGLAVAAGGLISFYLCTSLIACGLILLDFRIGVVLLILLMPMSGSSTIFPHEMFGIVGLNPLNLLLAGTLISCLLHALADGTLRQLLAPQLVWLYVVPILIAGAIGSRHIHEVAPIILMAFPDLNFPNAASYLIEMVFKPLLMVVFAVLVGAAVARSARPERFLAPAVVSMGVMAVLVLAFVAHSGVSLHRLASSEEREFLSPLGLHANDLGRLYASAFALALFSWSDSENRGLRLSLLLAGALSVVALILTFSRGGFVAFGVACGLYVLRRFSVKTLLIGCVVVAAAAMFAPHAIYERLTAGEGQGLDAISAGRLNGLWLPLLPEVLRHPLLGNGIGSILWSDAMHRLAPGLMLVVTHPHNAYLQAALDMGLTGLVLLCGYFVHVWKGFRALAKDPGIPPTLQGLFQGAAAGLLGMLVSDFTDSSLVPRPEHAFVWLAIGAMYGYRARRSAAVPDAGFAAGAASGGGGA
jgi:O-antigen ligase